MDFKQRVKNIREDKKHGAAYLARESVRCLTEVLQDNQAESRENLREEFLEAARQLIGVRPSMPAIGHLILRSLEIAHDNYIKGYEPVRLNTRIVQGLEQLIQDSRDAHELAVRSAAAHIPEDSVILTLSWSSNVQDALLRAGSKVQHVYAAEARPNNEGQLLAAALAEEKIPTTLITDAAMGTALDRSDICLVGADGVLQDGSLVNKTGSYLLALAAREADVPFYSICETHKYHVGAVPFELEHMPPEEIGPPAENLIISNYYFEVIPSRLIKRFITDLGVLTPHLAMEQMRSWQRRLSSKRLFGAWE